MTGKLEWMSNDGGRAKKLCLPSTVRPDGASELTMHMQHTHWFMIGV
jgi:hypothetical protein